MSRLSLTLDTLELAQHYEKISTDRQFKAGKVLIGELAIKPGESVLDVGSGTGLLAEYVATIVGPSGLVVGIDPLPLRIEIANRRARPNLSFQVGGTYELDRFPENNFGVVYLNAVFHWLPDKLAALRQFLRVLKPGGRLGLSTGSKDHPNRLQAIKREVFSQAPYKDYPEAQSGFPERVNPAELSDLFRQTGFTVKKLEARPNTNIHATAETAIEYSQASSFGNFLGHLPEVLQQSVRQEISRRLEELRTPEGIRQEGARIIAVAVKP